MVVILNILLIIVVGSSHLNIIVFFFLLVLVDVIVHYEFFKEIVLGASEWYKSVTLESITVASTFTF